MLFILHANCWVFMHIGAEASPLLYSTHQLAKANDAATNASNNVSSDESDEQESSVRISTARRDGSFTRYWEMVALPDVSALFAVDWRPKEVSPVSSVIVISTCLQFTNRHQHCKYSSISFNLGWLCAKHPEVDVDGAVDTIVAQKMSDGSALNHEMRRRYPSPFEKTTLKNQFKKGEFRGGRWLFIMCGALGRVHSIGASTRSSSWWFWVQKLVTKLKLQRDFA